MTSTATQSPNAPNLNNVLHAQQVGATMTGVVIEGRHGAVALLRLGGDYDHLLQVTMEYAEVS